MKHGLKIFFLILPFLLVIASDLQAAAPRHRAPARGRAHYALAEATDGLTYCFPSDSRGHVDAGIDAVDPSFCGAEAASGGGGGYDGGGSSGGTYIPQGSSYNNGTVCPEGWANGYGFCCPPSQSLGPGGCGN